MENASKALIIAGSVLIAILLISLGLIVFNSTSGVTQQAKNVGETLEYSTFNSQFMKYAGDNVKGGDVKTLLNYLFTYNGSHPSETIDYTSITVNTTKRYKVECKDQKASEPADGRVSKIVITALP